jgi:hypothetical protein
LKQSAIGGGTSEGIHAKHCTKQLKLPAFSFHL